MKILVTGGTGVVGKSAVNHLLERGHRVRLLSREAEHDARLWSEGVEPHPGSVADPAQLRGSADGCDAVLHVAGIVAEDPPEVTFEAVNVAGTRNVVREATRAGVGRFVYVSSLGADRGESEYHRSKRAAERIVQEEFPGEWLILRPGNVYGPGDEVVSAILKMVRTLPVVPVVGRGEHRFQPLWADDVGEALARAAEPDAPARRTLLLAGPERVSAGELLDMLEEITDRHPRRLPIPEWVAQHGAAAAEKLGVGLPFTEDQVIMLREENMIPPGEVNALEEIFGVRPTPLADGLRRLADSLPEQGPEEGSGALNQERYWADIRGSRVDADGLFALVREQFSGLSPDALLEVGVEPRSETRLEEGATLTLAVPLRGNIQVRVVEVEDHTVTCATVAGHFLAGVIRFEVEPRGDQLRFEVRSYFRAADLLDRIGMATVGKTAQKLTWTMVVEEAVRRSGGEAPEGIQTESRTLGERDAAGVERWVDDLLIGKQQEDNPSLGEGAGAG
ncbi:MAG: DUF1990 family protein, partial [Gemmatimonadota bacterium]|nr:DUF1990 family protein [Gemmatimonadota bacterium]